HCDRGIEGQYLETQKGQKFHPHCSICRDCGRVLSDDHFEIGDETFCERHAFSAVRGGGSGPKWQMEKRSTRFLVM
ncbi:hypothetical protein LTR28_009032, partial [Elasticomyces elasticus]